MRSIARDLGTALGCLGHVVWLRRTWSGPFHADQGISMEEIDAQARTPQLDEALLPLELGLADLPELITTHEGATRMRHGNPGLVLSSDAEYGDEAWASLDGCAVAVGRYRSGELHPSKVFQTFE